MKKIAGIIVAKVKTNYVRFTIALLLTKSRGILKALTGNASFPSPEPTLKDLQGFIDALQTLDTAVNNGDNTQVAARDAARVALLNAVSSIGNYVNFTAKGNIPALDSSGYDMYKTKETMVLVPAKTLLVESKPNTNSLFITAKGGKGIKYIIYQYTTDAKMAEGSWVSLNCGYRKCTIENLVKAQEYIVRVQYFGSHGQNFISDTISRIVQ